jgi:hypothetical protein
LYVQGTFLAVSAAALASNSAACPAPAPHAVAIPALGLEPLAPLRAGWDTAQALTDDPPLRLGEVAYRVAQILHEDGIEGVRVLFEEAIETGYIDLPIDIAAFMQEHAIRTHLDAYRVAAVGQARAGTCRGAGSLTWGGTGARAVGGARREYRVQLAVLRQRGQEVKDLSTAAAGELGRRLDEWWPDKPFADTITRTSPNSWRQENFAAAWLWFGPPLDKELTPSQWAESASCGVLFHDQTEWLKRKATEEAKQELARSCAAESARIWNQALQATPSPLPAELVNAVVANLNTATDEVYGLEYIGKRLYEAAGPDPLRLLSEVSDDFASALRPLLARDGDEEAQLTLKQAISVVPGRFVGWDRLGGVSVPVQGVVSWSGGMTVAQVAPGRIDGVGWPWRAAIAARIR